MSSCLFRTLSVVAICGVAAGCVSYQTYDELAFEQQKAVKSLNDLRAKYNRLIHKLHSAGVDPAMIEDLESQLDANARLISDLKNQIKELRFTKGDSAATDVPVGGKGQLILRDLLFKSGSADIGPKGRAALDRVAELLKTKYPGESFHLVGHTDNVPIRRSGYGTNLNLGLNRAYMVFKYLKQEHGFDEAQFIITSRGSTDPVAPNDSDTNRARNRRVEIFRIGRKM